MPESTSNEKVLAVRAAIKDRATWFYFFYKGIEGRYGSDVAEDISREAVREFGRMKAANEPSTSPKEWIQKHLDKGSGLVFGSKASCPEEDPCLLEFTCCPLLDRWRELGASESEQDLLCDIAMDGDRAKAEALGMHVEIPDRMGKGDEKCRLVINK